MFFSVNEEEQARVLILRTNVVVSGYMALSTEQTCLSFIAYIY
jgi:hypothetical protein